jgi:hypothetical protein
VCNRENGVPTWLRFVCNTVTRQMKEMCKRSFNASVIATLYAGERTFKGLKERGVHKAYELGKALASQLREA